MKIQGGSPRWRLDKTDLIKVLKGAGIAAVGAGLVYVGTWATGYDFGNYTAAVSALAAVLVNVVRKVVVDYS
jgi:hypothetical protein